MLSRRNAIIKPVVTKPEDQTLRTAIEQFLSARWRSESEIISAYRRLCKETHPDLSGRSGELFVVVQQAFHEALARLDARAGTPSGFDPYEVIRADGYPEQRPPRECFLISLMRYVALGLYSYRVRRNSELQKRNTRVVRSVEYWARAYDRELLPVFRAFDETQLRPLSSTAEMQRYYRARRVLLDGLHAFSQYQRSGRSITAEVAADRLRKGIAGLERVAPGDRSLGLARRLIPELDLPPVCAGLTGGREAGDLAERRSGCESGGESAAKSRHSSYSPRRFRTSR